jgi:hypothetical protein
VAERLPELPHKQRPRAEHDFSFLSDGNPLLLVRGVDFEPEVTLASVRRRIREWAERGRHSLEHGYVIETRTVIRHPKKGKTYRELKGIAARDRSVRPEYGLAVQLRRDHDAAKRRLRRYRRS